MGTSKSFSEANKSMIPNWGALSSAMTTSCNSSTLQSPQLQSILKNYVNVLGGATKAGRGGSKVGGKGGIYDGDNPAPGRKTGDNANSIDYNEIAPIVDAYHLALDINAKNTLFN